MVLSLANDADVKTAVKSSLEMDPADPYRPEAPHWADISLS